MHAFTVDVEDWYQSSYDLNAGINEICVTNTRKVLDFLSMYHTKGTFFVQGMVAKAFPKIVKEIYGAGHEIQSHGYSHRPINGMTSKEFLKELRETNARLEDITGEAVTGFRAPDFSIDRESFWAFEVMIEAGITYDSSIFPIKTRRYGISKFESGCSMINTPSGRIEELPVSIWELTRSIRLPVGGGGYIRLLPLEVLKQCFRSFVRLRRPFVLYCHPYEFNPQEWEQILTYVPLIRRIHQGVGRRKFADKVSWLLEHGSFGPIVSVLRNLRSNR